MTDLIVRAIRARHKSGEVDRPLQRMSVRDDVKVESDARFGKHRKRIDIEVESHGQSRPSFSIEAKCLRQSTHTIGLYTGEDGIMCFIKGDYAQKEPEAAMLGYLQTNDDAYWLGELKRKLTEDKDQLRLKRDLEPSLTPVFACEHTSSHSRSSGATILIHHILVDCK